MHIIFAAFEASPAPVQAEVRTALLGDLHERGFTVEEARLTRLSLRSRLIRDADGLAADVTKPHSHAEELLAEAGRELGKEVLLYSTQVPNSGVEKARSVSSSLFTAPPSRSSLKARRTEYEEPNRASSLRKKYAEVENILVGSASGRGVALQLSRLWALGLTQFGEDQLDRAITPDLRLVAPLPEDRGDVLDARIFPWALQ